jgi:calcineurin-like phosphoesterase family protein
MTHQSFFISDTHFSHSNILKFKRADGSPLRDFESIEEMDEFMVDNWNRVVRSVDRVYHLGDVAIKRDGLKILSRLNGKKVLIKGNHDIFKIKDYLPYFYDIRAYKVMVDEGIICSHIPIHPDSLSRWKLNLHGHLHANTIDDPRYRSVCVEQTNYTPISLDELSVV